MPLSELLNYRGRNEKPDDFDAYWDEAQREVDALGTAHELEDAAFQVPAVACRHLYFTGTGGARVHALLLYPRSIREAVPAVVMFHGYGNSAGNFGSKLGWVAAGFCVAAMDCRGQAGTSQDVYDGVGTTYHGHIVRGLSDIDPKKLYYRSVFMDTAQLARIVRSLPFVDSNRVGVCGGSQGGGLSVACAALTPGINRACILMPFLSDYRRVWEMNLARGSYQEITDYFRHYDPQHLREKEVFTRLGYVDTQHLAPRIRAKVRLYVGLMDDTCPPSTQFAIYNRLTCEKDYRVFPDFGHESFPDTDEDTMLFLLAME